MEHAKGYQALLKTGKFTFILPKLTSTYLKCSFIVFSSCFFFCSVKHSVMHSVRCALQL